MRICHKYLNIGNGFLFVKLTAEMIGTARVTWGCTLAIAGTFGATDVVSAMAFVVATASCTRCFAIVVTATLGKAYVGWSNTCFSLAAYLKR